MTENGFRCARAYYGHHRPAYIEGRIVFLDEAHLRTMCQHCGAQISRAHKRSAWWSVTDAAAVDMTEYFTRATAVTQLRMKLDSARHARTGGVHLSRLTALRLLEICESATQPILAASEPT